MSCSRWTVLTGVYRLTGFTSSFGEGGPLRSWRAFWTCTNWGFIFHGDHCVVRGLPKCIAGRCKNLKKILLWTKGREDSLLYAMGRELQVLWDGEYCHLMMSYIFIELSLILECVTMNDYEQLIQIWMSSSIERKLCHILLKLHLLSLVDAGDCIATVQRLSQVNKVKFVK